MKKLLMYSLGLLMTLMACKSNKIANDCKGKPNPDCVCTEQYMPVCGCDNQTYGNACVAQCAGVKSYIKGKCPEVAPAEKKQ